MSTQIIVKHLSPLAPPGDLIKIQIAPTIGKDSSSLADAIARAESSAAAAAVSESNASDSEASASADATSAGQSAASASSDADAAASSESSASNDAARAESAVVEATTLVSEYLGMMSESEARAINRINEAKYDASGFVHMGKHRQPTASVGVVNEGLTVYTGTSDYANKIYMGKPDWTSAIEGTSKTDFAVTHIAGAVANFITGTSTFLGQAFQLPPAEDGTRIYDSTGDARGSGKASLDLKVDVDPKYGDIPTGSESEIHREAEGRAFEGSVKNGDFRLGDNGDWYWPAPADIAITTGSMTLTGTGSSSTVTIDDVIESSAEYVVEVFVESLSATEQAYAYYSDSTGFTNLRFKDVGLNKFYITTSTNASGSFRLKVNAGHSCVITSVSVRKVTEEVVTHPVDGVFLECWEEELTGRQEVFECIQSLGITFGTTGVPTVLSTRKLSYFQQYDGQFPEVTANPDFINDRYRCVVWSDLSEEDKRKVAAYMGEKLFVGVNGNIVNGRLRARTIRGLGNGDWISNNALGSYSLAYSLNTSRVQPHGILDAAPPLTNTSSLSFNGTLNTANSLRIQSTDAGVFNQPASKFSYQGRCFMYVVATVPRANKGAYVEGLNEYGTSRCNTNNTGFYSGTDWYTSVALAPRTLSECFIFVDSVSDTTTYGAAINSGSIGLISGHPDGIFYDGITAGGLNGIIDWRLGAVANDSPEEAAKVEAKVENGTYRGLEKLVWTEVDAIDSAVTARGSIYWTVDEYLDVKSNSNVITHIVADTGEVVPCGSITNPSGTETRLYWLTEEDREKINVGDRVRLVRTDSTNLSVSGEFNTQMVIGDPANILLIDALKDGWLGTWCPVIPSVGTGDYPLTRKAVSSTARQLYTADGISWTSSASKSIDATTNSVELSLSATSDIVIEYYKAFAKQTKPSTNKPVYNGKAGLMGVYGLCNYRDFAGSLLTESLIGKVMTSNGTRLSDTFVLISLGVSPFNTLDIANRYGDPAHAPLTLSEPTNNSPAVKVLPYQISNNGQGSIGYQANELTWSDDAGTAIEVTTSAAYSYESGKTYALNHADFGVIQGTYWTFKQSTTNNAAQILASLVSYLHAPWRESSIAIVWDGSGWGDDGTIKITADGSDTFVDRNGIVNESVVHELAIPYTWTSNHARAGVQVPGVDL